MNPYNYLGTYHQVLIISSVKCNLTKDILKRANKEFIFDIYDICKMLEA